MLFKSISYLFGVFKKMGGEHQLHKIVHERFRDWKGDSKEEGRHTKMSQSRAQKYRELECVSERERTQNNPSWPAFAASNLPEAQGKHWKKESWLSWTVNVLKILSPAALYNGWVDRKKCSVLCSDWIKTIMLTSFREDCCRKNNQTPINGINNASPQAFVPTKFGSW